MPCPSPNSHPKKKKPATLLDNAIYRSQAEARPFTNRLGGKERLKKMRLGFCVHASSRVAHREHHIAPPWKRYVFPDRTFFANHGGGFHHSPTPLAHGVTRIYP